MNPYEILLEIRAALLAAVWAGGEVVFASVHATAGVPSPAAFASLRLPCALIQIGSAAPDDEEPGLIRQTYEVTVCQAVAGDTVSENVIVGANKTGGATSSRGRGLAEIEERMKQAIQELGPGAGVRLMFKSSSDAGPVETGEAKYAAFRVYSFEAWTVTQAGQ